MGPVLILIRRSVVCHHEASEKGRGNLRLLELRINFNYHSGHTCVSSH
jgi:hypothetical protein